MYSFNRSSNFIFIRTSPFVLLFFIIRKGSEEFCNPVTKYLYGYFLMYIMVNKNDNERENRYGSVDRCRYAE